MSSDKTELYTELYNNKIDKDVINQEEIPLNWQPGQVIAGLYQVEDTTSGGMGAVYFVKHLQWGIPLAVKTPLPDIVQDEASMKRFIKEAETWVDLGLHPHIATCYYVRLLGNLPRIFIEYVDGGSIKEWLKERDAKNLIKILDIAIQICRGMEHVHEKGVIHRDLKPDNCLITKDGNVKVTDFGLVKIGEEIKGIAKLKLKLKGIKEGNISIIGSSFGTPEYMPPEQFKDAKNVRKTADIYSYGVMLYEMVCGRRPFVMPERMHPSARVKFYGDAHQIDIPIEPISLRSDCPRLLNELLLKCLEKSPSKRYSSFQEIEGKLLEIYQDVIPNKKAYFRKRPDPLKLRADALNNRAISLLDLGHEEDAEKTWKEALKISPYHLASIFNHGYYQWYKNKLDPYNDYYLGTLKALEEFYVNEPEYWYNLTLICAEIGLTSTTKEAAKKAASQGCKKERIMDNCEHALSLLKTFVGHNNFVLSVVISPDGRYAISGSQDGTLRLWNIEDKRCLMVYKGHSEGVTSISVSPDGRYFISGSADKTIMLWEKDTGKCLRIFKGYTGPILTIALSCNNRYIISGGEDKAIRLWDIETGICLKTFEGHIGFVRSVAITRDGKNIISGGDKTIRLWDIETRKCKVFEGHAGFVRSVAVTCDCRYIISGGEDNTIRLWELGAGKCLRIFEGHSGWVESISTSSDSKYLVSGGKDNTIRLWEIETGKCLRVFDGHAKAVKSVFISLDSKLILSGSEDYTLRLWEVNKPKLFQYIISFPSSYESVIEITEKVNLLLAKAYSLIKEGKYSKAYTLLQEAKEMPGYSKDPQILDLINICGLKSGTRKGLNSAICFKILEGHTKGINSLSSLIMDPNSRYVISGGSDYTIRLWEIETGNCLKVFEDRTKINSLCISPNNRYVISGCEDKMVRLWEIKTGKCPKVFKGHTGTVRAVAITCDGDKVVSGSWDKTIRLWKIETGECLKVFKGPTDTGFIRTIAVTDDGKYVISGSWDKTIRLWEIETGKCLKIFEGHTGWIESIATTPDSKYIISGGEDKTIRLWEIETGKCLKIFEGHTGWIESIATTPDSKYVISGGEDKTIRLWEIESGKCLKVFEGHTGTVRASVITHDGRYIISGSEDRTIRIWELDWEWEFSQEKSSIDKEEYDPATKFMGTKGKSEILNKKTQLKQENIQSEDDANTISF